MPWEDEQVLTRMRVLNSRSVSVTLCLYSSQLFPVTPITVPAHTAHRPHLLLSITLSSRRASLPVPPSRSFSHLHNSVPLAWMPYLRCPWGGALTTSGLCPEATFSRFCPSLCKNATTCQNQGRWFPSAALSFLHNPNPHWTHSIIVYCIFPPTRMSFRG